MTFGTLSDRWGRVPTALLSYVATAAGTLALLLLAPGSPGWLLWAYVLPFGLTLGARGPIVAALTADVYRGRSFGPVLGVITFGNRVGSAIGPWLGGVIYDLTGSYRYAFVTSLAALALAAGQPLARAGSPPPLSGRRDVRRVEPPVARHQSRAPSLRSASSRRLPYSWSSGQPDQEARIIEWTWR